MSTEQNLIYFIGGLAGVSLCLLGAAYAIGQRTGVNYVLKCLKIYDTVTGAPLWKNASTFFKDNRKGDFPVYNGHRVAITQANGLTRNIEITGTRFPFRDTGPIPPGIFEEKGYYIISGKDLKQLLIANGFSTNQEVTYSVRSVLPDMEGIVEKNCR